MVIISRKGLHFMVASAGERNAMPVMSVSFSHWSHRYCSRSVAELDISVSTFPSSEDFRFVIVANGAKSL